MRKFIGVILGLAFGLAAFAIQVAIGAAIVIWLFGQYAHADQISTPRTPRQEFSEEIKRAPAAHPTAQEAKDFAETIKEIPDFVSPLARGHRKEISAITDDEVITLWFKAHDLCYGMPMQKEETYDWCFAAGVFKVILKGRGF